MSNKCHKLLTFLTFIISGLLISFSVMASPAQGFFSEDNIKALKNDPLVLFSKSNACHLKSILGKKDYPLFKESMSLETSEEAAADDVVISGGVRGLFTIYEGFFRMSSTGNVWIAYLYDNKVHYFTNDEASLKQPPKIMVDWYGRFKEAKWITKQVTVNPKACK